MTVASSENTRRRTAAALAIVTVATVMLGLRAATFAQDADGRPARIHAGSCAALGAMSAELTGIGAAMDDAGTPVAAPEQAGSEQALPIDVSATTLDVKMSDLLDTPHAIAVYERDTGMDQPLVCGAVGGAMMMQMPGMAMPGDEVAIWLAPVSDAPYAGMALLRSEVGGASTITIYLARQAPGSAAGAGADAGGATAEATPEPG